MARLHILLLPLALLPLGGCASLADMAMAGAMQSIPTLPVAEPEQVAAAVDIPADGRIDLSINGRPVTAFAGPGLSSRLHISSGDAAALFGPAALRFDARGDWPGALRASERIGPVVVQGHRAPALLAFGFGQHTSGVEWFSAEVPGGTAQLGPYALPATIVRFALRAPQPGERLFTLPLDEEDNGWGIASTSLLAGRQQVRFAFAPHFPRSVASAAAGGALARAQGGRFMGQPEDVVISHGVARPARPVRLDRAIAIGPVQLRDMLVRTLDYGAATGIADQLDEPENPSDILVTGRADRQRPQYIVYLGADVLGGCSSVTFDKAAMTVTLSCVGG
jgi:hypothetical protein